MCDSIYVCVFVHEHAENDVENERTCKYVCEHLN